MTPKEKAIELVDKYKSGYTIGEFNYQFWNDLRDAKQCALIAVDEILNCDDIDVYGRKYYKEVKYEIENL